MTYAKEKGKKMLKNIKYLHICNFCCIFAENFGKGFGMRVKEEQWAPMWELNPLWATLTEAERDLVSQVIEVVQYEKNEIIHHDGDDSEYVWMLLEGKVRIFKEGIGQRSQIIRLLKPYDIFGYRQIFRHHQHHLVA